MVNLVLGKVWDLIWQILYAIEQFFIDVIGQILKKLQSHCLDGTIYNILFT